MSHRRRHPGEGIRRPEPLELYADLLRRSILFTDPNGHVEHIDSIPDTGPSRCRFLIVGYRSGEVTTIRIVERSGVGGYSVTMSSRAAPTREQR